MTDRPPPDFAIGGADKSGTSSLWAYMSRHPDICMASLKEPRYFVPNGSSTDWSRDGIPIRPGGGRYERGRQWYAALFSRCRPGTVRGEGSTVYLRSPDAPGLLRRDAPHARMIFLLRDPAARVYSQYLQQRRRRRLAPFEQIVHQDPARLDYYLDGSRYADHLTRWHEHFPSDQILVMLTEDLAEDALSVVSRAFSFVGVEPSFVPPNIGERYNEAMVGRLPTLNRAVLGRVDQLPISLARFVRAVGRPVRRLIYRRIETAPLDPALRSELIGKLSGDIDRLERLLGRDLSSWRAVRPDRP